LEKGSGQRLHLLGSQGSHIDDRCARVDHLAVNIGKATGLRTQRSVLTDGWRFRHTLIACSISVIVKVGMSCSKARAQVHANARAVEDSG
jgi:hypothetical protein